MAHEEGRSVSRIAPNTVHHGDTIRIVRESRVGLDLAQVNYVGDHVFLTAAQDPPWSDNAPHTKHSHVA